MAFKKVMCFVFINILALFPVFLSSLAAFRVCPNRGISIPATSPRRPVPRPGVCDVNKLEFWFYFTHLRTQLGLVLSSFSLVSDIPFCVVNNILASFVLFLVFFGPVFSPMPGLLRFSTRSEACPRQCVHNMTMIIGYHS